MPQIQSSWLPRTACSVPQSASHRRMVRSWPAEISVLPSGVNCSARTGASWAFQDARPRPFPRPAQVDAAVEGPGRQGIAVRREGQRPEALALPRNQRARRARSASAVEDPAADVAVPASRDQRLAVRREDQGLDPVLVRLEGGQERLAGLEVPEPDLAVISPGGQQSAVRRIGQAANGPGMSLKQTHGLLSSVKEVQSHSITCGPVPGPVP